MNVPILKRAAPPAVVTHPGTAAALVIGALHGRPCDLPQDALEDLIAHNNRLAETPGKEVEATLRRQAILLEHVHLAYLRKAAEANRADWGAVYAKIALRASDALLKVLGAIRAMDEARKDAEALDG